MMAQKIPLKFPWHTVAGAIQGGLFLALGLALMALVVKLLAPLLTWAQLPSVAAYFTSLWRLLWP